MVFFFFFAPGEESEKAKAGEPSMMPFPTTTHEVMVKLAKEKAALDQKIIKLKTEGERACLYLYLYACLYGISGRQAGLQNCVCFECAQCQLHRVGAVVVFIQL